MPPMPAPAPAYANVAFFRIPDFAARPVSEQAMLKTALEAHAQAAIAGLPAGERIVLDAEDGLALVLFGPPGRALDVTQAVHAQGEGAAMHAGLNFGPLALSSRGSDARVLGDGLVAAAAAARFASPQRLLVTEEFAKALEAADPQRAHDLASAGEFTDTRVRLHSFFTPDLERGRGRRRRSLVLAAVGVIGILALGALGRDFYRKANPALVKFQVKPRGDIFVDGAFKGRSPPINDLEIVPGRHVVQVKSAGQPPLELTLDLQPGEQVTITHTFGRPQAAGSRSQPQGLWRDLKKKLGW